MFRLVNEITGAEAELANWSPGSLSGLRDPTPEERGCASALFRLMLLVVLYASAWRLSVAALGPT
jgi:hypothetical protein